jgi:hypothetical protein
MMVIEKKQRPLLIAGTALGLLLIPFIAMQFSNEVDWTAADFLVMGVLLLGVGFLVELAIRHVPKLQYRVVAIMVILGIFFLVWAELAVGIF